MDLMLIDSVIIPYHEMECGLDFWKLQTAEKWFIAAMENRLPMKNRLIFWCIKRCVAMGDHFSPRKDWPVAGRWASAIFGNICVLSNHTNHVQMIAAILELITQIPQTL